MSPVVELLRRHARLTWRVVRAYAVPTAAKIAPLAGRLIALGYFDLAERLLKRGLERAPDSFELLEQYAFCAHNSGRYRLALARWHRARNARPDASMAWCGIASNARELGLVEQAATVVTEALQRFPDDFIVISEGARVREAQEAHVEAADLWARMLEHPLPAKAWRISLVRNLLILQRYDEVERVVATLTKTLEGGFGGARRQAAIIWSDITVELARQRPALLLPSHQALEERFGEEAFAVAKICETTENLREAREVLRRILEKAPADLEARECYVRVLVRLGLLVEAEQEIALGLRLSPRHDRLRALRGSIAMRKQDWASAELAWQEYAEKQPDDSTARDLIFRLQIQQGFQAAADPRMAPRPVPVAPGLHDDPELRRLMLSFESIGTNCDFGTVQRRYGAEPLGLLRWTETSVPTLMAAIAADFSGIGEAGNTELTVELDGRIYIRDTRWHFLMHTFLNASEVSLDDLLPKMRRRTAYLRDKFLRDVRAGEKTLVYRDDTIDRTTLLALHDAFRRLGPVRLLHVRLAAGSGGFSEAEAGTAIQLRPGLFVGRVAQATQPDDVIYGSWIDVCRRVENLAGTRWHDGPVEANCPVMVPPERPNVRDGGQRTLARQPSA